MYKGLWPLKDLYRGIFLGLPPAEIVSRGCYKGEDEVNSGAKGKPGEYFSLL
jgi:hypothetical protein